MEEGKDPVSVTRTSPARAFPQRLIHMLVLFLAVCFTFSVLIIYMIRYFKVNTLVISASPTLLACNTEFKNVKTLEEWIGPPSDLMHQMNDTELFWRASLVPQVENYPFKRVPKIAFMFLTKGPLPLAPLWERFFKGHDELYSIYIHSLPSYEAQFSPSSVFYKRQIPSQVSEWGKMSMCDAERRLLANALLDISNERFVLLSESCIPLYNFSTIYSYITGSKHSFTGSLDEAGPDGRGRYQPEMLPEVDISQWRKGPQWFEVSRRLAVYIVEDTIFYPKFAAFCQPPCYVDEHYFPTLLGIRAGGLLANRSLMWVDWSRGGAHPATFGGLDVMKEFLEELVKEHKCSYNDGTTSLCYLFARKFSQSTLETLLLGAHKYFRY